MKVLHVIPAVSPKYGGPSNALLPMCRALQARGVKVQIASTDAEPGGHIQVELESPTTYEGIPAIFFRKQWSEAFKYSFSMASWLGRSVADFDLVHIHGVFSHACLSVARACQRHQVPYVIRPLGHIEPWSLAQKPLRKKLFLKLGGAGMLRNAAAVQYVSASEKQASEAALRMNHGVVIPLGVELDPTTSSVAQNGKRPAALRPYVLVLSRLQPTKGIDVLLEAFLGIRQDKRLTDWQLVIAGDGPPQYEALLKRIIKQSNAGDSVQLTGWIEGEAKTRALAGASLLALPSHRDSFGLCVAEAMARGIPVLVSPQVGLAADVEAAGAGWISPVDTESIYDTLRNALNDPNEMVRRGAAGRELAHKFDWDNLGEMLAQLYESLLSSRDNQ